MKKQVIVITDLGGGDGGKGGVVHSLCSHYNAHTVVKVGGAQGSHGVHTSKGESFNFSQFGCGTFDGVRTHISNLMVVEPFSFLEEGNKLMYEWGIREAFNLVTLDERVLCVTPYHTFASRLKELARKDSPKGTVGVGVGEAFLDQDLGKSHSIYVRDIHKSKFKKKLKRIRDKKISEVQYLIDNPEEGFKEEDLDLAKEQIRLMLGKNLFDLTVQEFETMCKLVKVVDDNYLYEEILSKDGMVVVESSHGILTDRYNGFYPNVSRLRTTPNRVIDMIKARGYDGDVKLLGVIRAFQIRHGAGPMVTESSELLDQLLPGSNKDENRWQGRVRVGPLDFVSLRYSIGVCGGPEAFYGIAVTWFDQVESVGKWDLCDSYINANDSVLFDSKGIIIRQGVDEDQLIHQTKLSNALKECRPEVSSIDLTPYSKEEDLIQLCSEVIQDKTGVTVRMISFGPNEDHKTWLGENNFQTIKTVINH